MKKRPTRITLRAALGALLLAAGIVALLDLLCIVEIYLVRPHTHFLRRYKYALALGLCLVWALLLTRPFRRLAARALPAMAIALAVVLAAQASLHFAWRQFSASAVYKTVDAGKAAQYRDKRVLLIAPHEDDDLNLLGGAIEEYLRYGSEFFVAFMSNGDYQNLGETRLREAISLYGFLGVPEDHVIFLGYGDQYMGNSPHVYNAGAGQVATSFIGRTRTYGIPGHPAYRDGEDYTRENLIGDMESLILEIRPDVIYCVDWDYHADHRATSLAFERAMGRVLNNTPDYAPQVFKGFAYCTAWRGVRDYYGENILSSQTARRDTNLGTYRWSERVRLPVLEETLSRSLFSAGTYKTLAHYASQKAVKQAESIINGDKVFWQRRTDSLCRGAQIEATSGDGARLNDFMLLDTDDVADLSRIPAAGAWVPDADDARRSVTVTFDAPRDVDTIVLYDSVLPDSDVLNAEIRFDDGTVLETGALEPMGTPIPVGKTGVRGFEVALTQVSGEGAGLTEIEAFGPETAESTGFVKLMDDHGDFAYDYWLPADGHMEFEPYLWGGAPAADGYAASADDERCGVSYDGARLTVDCPAGVDCVITLASADGVYADSVRLRNPGRAARLHLSAMQLMDRFMFVLRHGGRASFRWFL